jgi:hypothetical protein
MKITNQLGLPQPFVSAAESEHTYTPRRYGLTSLLKSTRESILQRRHDDEIEQDVADMAWLIFGTAVHSVLEHAKETDTQLKENWVSADMPNGYVVSGVFDLYDDATGTVTDYKTASVWKVIFADWDDYRKQTLLYCWILRQMGFDAHRGEIVALLKDHSKTDALRKHDYPPFPIYRIGWDFGDADWAWAKSFLEAKFAEIEAAEKLPDEQLPECTADERWHKPDKWAAKKPANKKATKLFDDEAEANAYAEANKLVVEFRQGEDAKCMKYCSAREFCDHYKEITKEAGDDGSDE